MVDDDVCAVVMRYRPYSSVFRTPEESITRGLARDFAMLRLFSDCEKGVSSAFLIEFLRMFSRLKFRYEEAAHESDIARRCNGERLNHRRVRRADGMLHYIACKRGKCERLITLAGLRTEHRGEKRRRGEKRA